MLRSGYIRRADAAAAGRARRMGLHPAWYSGSGRMTERTEGEGHYLPANRGTHSAWLWAGSCVVLGWLLRGFMDWFWHGSR